MLFTRKLPLVALIEMCDRLRLMLSAGLTLSKIFGQMATGSSPAVRPVAARIHARLERGESLSAALEPEKSTFPPLFLAMSTVGEETGRLPEVMAELEQYYQLQLQSWRKLRSRSLLPLIQFLIAIGVLTLLIYVLGVLAQSRGTQPQGVFGLRGPSGALTFLLSVAGLFAGVYLLYWLVTRCLGHQVSFDRAVLCLPAVGPCLRVFAVGRFALAAQLTLDSSLPTAQAVRWSLEATGNAAFQSKADVIARAVKKGEAMTVALSRGRIFPAEFLSMIAVAEEGGRLVEMMQHQAAHYREEGERRLKALTRALTFAIWLVYAVFMVSFIMQLAGNYLRALGS
jgi:type II secretory pathway component PulF